MASAHAELTERRRDYPILATKTYLANHTLGAMHRGTRDRLAEYADLWATHGVVAWETWAPEMDRVADLVGSLVGAAPGTTVLRQNVADLLGDLVSAIVFTPSCNGIVYCDQDWPGSHYLWQEHRRSGAQPRVVAAAVRSPEGIGFDPNRLVEAIDETTALVYLSRVLFRTATIADVAPVIARAHEVGALFVLDAYQAAGAIPIDVVALDVDVCVGGSVKYLCGGPGVGWMYVKPEIVERLVPQRVGWFGHSRPFGFEFEADVGFVPAPGVRRFAGGTPGVPAAYAAEPGYRALAEVGVTRWRERSISLTQPMVEAMLERGWSVPSPHNPQHRGGHVTVDPGEAQAVAEALIARGFVVDHRPGAGIRIAPHFFTTEDECSAVIAEMDSILAGLR